MKTKITLFAMLFISTFVLQAQSIMNIHQNNGVVLQIPLNTIDSITYTIPNPGNLATLTTLPAGNITDIAAASGGNISNNGGTIVTQRGVVWNISPNPTTANNSTNDGTGTGSFTSNLTGLNASTTYYVRAYATNSAGTAYGNEISFKTAVGIIVSNPGAGVTFDGYTYSSIVLGNGQEWMSENLRTIVYSNYDTIPNVTNNIEFENVTTGAWVNYDNDPQYENPYGKLYNWRTVVDPRNVCPTGWHIPSAAEFTLLTNYLGGASVAGGKMKSTGTQYWTNPNTNATNESGFSGLPGGNYYGVFNHIEEVGYWWTSNEKDANYALMYVLNYDKKNLINGYDLKYIGASVRCIKD